MPNPRTMPGRGRAKAVAKPSTGAPDLPGPKVGDRKWMGHCMKCAKEGRGGKQEITNPKRDQFKNGTKIVKGECGGCGSTLNLIVAKDVWENFVA